MKILGIHDGHNSSACLLINGEVKFAIQEERLRRIKNYWGIPELAIKNCLSSFKLSIKDIDIIAIASNNQFLIPKKNIARDSYMSSMHLALEGNFSLRQNISLIKDKFCEKIKLNSIKNKKNYRVNFYEEIYGKSFVKKTIFLDHHFSHYTTAAFGSGYWGKHKFLTFTLDGQGDGLCGTVSLINKNKQVTKVSEIIAKNSIANFYGIITVCLGFNLWEDEYKIMGMAPYANPSKAKKLGDKFLQLFEWVGEDFKMKNNIKRLMDRDERHLKKKINEIIKFERFDNICGGVQYAFEEIVSNWINNYVTKYDVNYVALAGGAFMNVKANLKISQLPKIDNLFIYPSCGDETISIGAAMGAYFKSSKKAPLPVTNIYYGNSYNNSLRKTLNSLKQNNSLKIYKEKNIEKKSAKLLAKNEIIARFSGCSEFGARALGNRSILANPSNIDNVRIINDMIKKRDFWMPFACSIIDDEANEYLYNKKNICSPYMIMSFVCNKNSNKIQASIHPRDKTVRPQIVKQKDNPKYYQLIKYFNEYTSIGGVLNTSFNLHGFPLVETPDDAIKVLLNSGLKYLVLEDYLIEKNI